MKEYYSEFAALMVGLSGSLFAFLRGNRQDNSEEIKLLMDRYKELYTAVKVANEECERKYRHLFEEMLQLKEKLNTL
jgi:hypothetical protein